MCSRRIEMERLYHSPSPHWLKLVCTEKDNVSSQCTLTHTLAFTYVGDADVGVGV